MIQIEDYDMPITAAQKIITGVMPWNASDFEKSLCKAISGEAKTEKDMFTLEEIEEIANYLMVYVRSHEKGD